MPFDDLRSNIAAITQPNPISFRAVNGWRGPGALAIAFAHFSVATDFVSYRRLEPIALLVDLFFVLSGLIIAQVYAQKLARPAAIPEYIVRRFGRIWPLQAATLGVLIAYELAKLALQTISGHRFSSPAFSPAGFNLVQAIPTNLLLIHSLGLHDRETWNFPSWSLSVEFATYLSFAIFCLVRPFTRRVLSLITVIASLAILMTVAPYHMRSTFDFGIFRCLAGFFAGTLCYDVARRWGCKVRAPTLAEMCALALVLAWMSVASHGPLVYAAPFVFCAFVLAFASERGALSRVLTTKPLQLLAELSFAIYMVHALILILFLALLHQVEAHIGHALFVRVANPLFGAPGAPATVDVLHITSRPVLWACAALYGTAVLGTAYAAYKWIEVPGRAYFGRFAKIVDLTRPRDMSTAAAAQPSPEAVP